MNLVSPSPNTASISSNGTPIVSGYTFARYQVRNPSKKEAVLTEINDNETAHAEESMHGVQPPRNDFLQPWGDHPNDEIEEPVRRG